MGHTGQAARGWQECEARTCMPSIPGPPVTPKESWHKVLVSAVTCVVASWIRVPRHLQAPAGCRKLSLHWRESPSSGTLLLSIWMLKRGRALPAGSPKNQSKAALKIRRGQPKESDKGRLKNQSRAGLRISQGQQKKHSRPGVALRGRSRPQAQVCHSPRNAHRGS